MITRLDRDEHGITLVELLVVLVIFGIVGGMVFSGIVSSLRTTTRAQDRIDAMTELEKSVERIGRELRAACQVNTFEPDDVSVDVVREGNIYRYRYVLGSVLGGGQVPDALYEVRSVRDPSTGSFGSTSTRLFLNDVDNTTLFVYSSPDGTAPGVATEVSKAEITLRGTPANQNPIEVRTGIHLRNHGGFSCLT